jgi:hypothetical protein
MNLPYRREQDVYIIDMRLTDLRQLFNSLDPAPFIEKDLDDDAESYIVESVRDFHLNTPLRLAIHLPAATPPESVQGIPESVHNYFAYRAERANREFKFTLRQGRHSLLIGLAFLFLCVSIRRVLELTTQGTFAVLVQEGLLISGWVAMWRPFQIFLYDWWPIRRKRRVYEKIQNMPIEVKLSDGH